MINLTYKAVENSKNTSGESGNYPSGGSGQLPLELKQEMVAIAANMGCTHFAHHLYMDTNAQMEANYSAYGTNYNLYTLEEETQQWFEVIHDAGMKVISRGSFSGIKANNNFPAATYGGTAFVPLGTPATASTQGESTYCGKLWRWMDVNVGSSNWEDGDIVGPISEATEYLSNAAYIFFDTTGGTQAGFVDFYLKMHETVRTYGSAIGKSLDYFTIINYSEYRTGYLGTALPADTNHIAIDYYGHTGGFSQGSHVEPEHYVEDWIAVRTQVGGAGYPLFQTEMGGIWSDSWPTLGAVPGRFGRRITTYEDAVLYQKQFWQAYRDSLIDEELMDGVNNWGFWSGQNSSILGFANGHYYLNYMGQIYSNFLKGNGMGRIPVPENSTFSADAWGGRSITF